MMNINIQGINLDLTDSIKEYIYKKIETLEKYIDAGDTSVLVEVEVEKTTDHHKTGDIFSAAINFTLQGELHRSSFEHADLYAAIDEAKEEMSRILRKSKGKSQTLYRRGRGVVKDLMRGFGGGFDRLSARFRRKK